MAGGKYVKGQPSSNPTGRPTKLESRMRKLRPVLEPMGATENEIRVAAQALLEEDVQVIQFVMAIICARHNAKLGEAALAQMGPGQVIASFVENPHAEDYF